MICSNCRKDRPEEEYKKLKGRGLGKMCEACRGRRREYNRKYNKEHPEQAAEYFTIHKHSITRAEYFAMSEQQQGLCAICKRAPLTLMLCVDHDHATGKTRGLLCSTCNTGLGLFYDNVEFLEAAIKYLGLHQISTVDDPQLL